MEGGTNVWSVGLATRLLDGLSGGCKMLSCWKCILSVASGQGTTFLSCSASSPHMQRGSCKADRCNGRKFLLVLIRSFTWTIERVSLSTLKSCCVCCQYWKVMEEVRSTPSTIPKIRISHGESVRWQNVRRNFMACFSDPTTPPVGGSVLVGERKTKKIDP